jgi:hypothetical protein
LPRGDADLYDRVEMWSHYRSVGFDDGDTIMRMPIDESPHDLRANGQLYSIACLIPKELFARYRFRGEYAEDLDLGVRLIRDGHKLAFIRSTEVIHSHNRPAYYYLKKGCVDALAMARIVRDRERRDVTVAQLFRDLILTYNVLNSLVREELEWMGVPCRWRDLSNVVTRQLLTARGRRHPVAIDVAQSGDVDSNLRAFLENVYVRYGAGSSSTTATYDGVLLSTLLDWLQTTFAYMARTYEVIDGDVLREFRSHLYKSYATQSGREIAHCYLGASGGDKEILEEIIRELAKGV